MMAVLCHGSTSKVTTGGDHLVLGGAVTSDTVAAGAGAGAVARDATGKPEAGIGRGDATGARTDAAAFGHGSVIKPCCASAALPTNRQTTRALKVDECLTALAA